MKNIFNVNVLACLFSLTSLTSCFGASGGAGGGGSSASGAQRVEALFVLPGEVTEMGCAVVCSCSPGATHQPYYMALTKAVCDKSSQERITARAEELVAEVYCTGRIDLSHVVARGESKQCFIVPLNLWEKADAPAPLRKLGAMVRAMPLLFSRCLNECFEEPGTRELSVFCMQAVITAFVKKARTVLARPDFDRLVSSVTLLNTTPIVVLPYVAFLSIDPMDEECGPGVTITTIQGSGLVPVLSPEGMAMINGKAKVLLNAAFAHRLIMSSFKLPDGAPKPVKEVGYSLPDGVLDVDALSHLLVTQVLAECVIDADESISWLPLVGVIQRVVIDAINEYKTTILGPSGPDRRASGASTGGASASASGGPRPGGASGGARR